MTRATSVILSEAKDLTAEILRRSLFRLTAATLLFSLAPAAALADPFAKKLDAPPPGALPAKVREVLAPQGLRITDASKVIADFWLRRELQPVDGSRAGPGVNFGTIGEGTLVGAVRFPSGWSDYRGHPVAQGVYTLRYALQPVDGNHVGVSEFRDFLLLVPATADPGFEVRPSHDELIALSGKASARPHPAVLALVPGGDTPNLVKASASRSTLYVSCGSFRLGLVVIGKTEAEE